MSHRCIFLNTTFPCLQQRYRHP